MSIEHVVEVESIDKFRGKKFDVLDLFHKDCDDGQVVVEKDGEGAKLFCYGCYFKVATPSSSKLREIIDLALHGDEDSVVEYRVENKNKTVKFILASE